MFDVLRHPISGFSAFSRDGAVPTAEDRDAVWGSEGRIVSCFLRASFDSLPQRWAQGHLQLDGTGIRWEQGRRWRANPTPLSTTLRVRTVRGVEGNERRRLKASLFQVIVATTEEGVLLLGIPKDSIALVAERLQRDAGTERDA
jgi:hypothetical protein